MHYRRTRIPGGTYFFTVNLHDRRQDLLTRHVDALRDAVRTVHRRHPFDIIAWVVLPDHLHAIWALPPQDADYSTRWMLIKSGFSRRISSSEPRTSSRKAKGERGIWQRRFWEHLIRDERDLQNHRDYVHFNPVKHGLVDTASSWPWSSIHRSIRQGEVAPDWASTCDAGLGGAGEAGVDVGVRLGG